jgi:hypothetical protein
MVLGYGLRVLLLRQASRIRNASGDPSRAILKTQSRPPVQVEPKHISSYLRRLEPFASPRPVFLGQIDERTLRAFPMIAAARTPFCNSSPLTGHYPPETSAAWRGVPAARPGSVLPCRKEPKRQLAPASACRRCKRPSEQSSDCSCSVLSPLISKMTLWSLPGNEQIQFANMP